MPFAAGGPTDVVARLVGEHMSRTLGQTLIVENVGGAGGTSGHDPRRPGAAGRLHHRGRQHGHAVGGAGALSEPQIRSGNELRADRHRQLHAAGDRGQEGARRPANLKEFIDYLKANSSKLSYGHAGVGSISHVAGLVFNAKFGFKPNLVPYRGTGPALQDLVGGQIDYMVDQSLNVIPQIKAGTIKVYAIAAPERLESLPDVPTTKEAGVDFIFSAWNAMVAPKDTPKDIVDKLADALSKALDDPAVKARYVELGSTAPQGAERGPAGLQKLVESEVARITPVIKAAGVTAD